MIYPLSRFRPWTISRRANCLVGYHTASPKVLKRRVRLSSRLTESDELYRMSDARPPTSPAQTQTDDDAAFTAALYSRIRGDEPPAAPRRSSTWRQGRTQTPRCRRIMEAAQRTRYDRPPAVQTLVAPPACGAGIARLQREAGRSEKRAHCTQRYRPSAPSPLTKPSGSYNLIEMAPPRPRSARDLPPLLPSEPRCAHVVRRNRMSPRAQVPMLGMGSPRAACQGPCDGGGCGRRIKRYFEAEADVVAVAERTMLQEWAHKSKSLFAEVILCTANALTRCTRPITRRPDNTQRQRQCHGAVGRQDAQGEGSVARRSGATT